ncbi:DUF488 domain-containing protein [Sphingomonas sp. SORGH_AS_0438]|uniref:DUF488 domain-containing protein n=1 Tax=Sphingomonas sp. SORGH_AS_0438 TaxID=3041756 RepID=UPI00285F08F7|nr:DUF488 domain-containing protein [Sphingomonas sp. SORGH_AS_0438]MDR6129083.1 uncharacterized protein (DUF488 family) [Sphingomonas sp. SORGH_AS_0438]
MPKLFTIGYSGLEPSSFVELLTSNLIDVVCDVRSTPYSHYKPDFSRVPLRGILNNGGIKYVFMGDQLGARPKDRSCYVNGQATYDRISSADFFKAGLSRLRNGVQSLNLAIVCSERDPIECHRAVLVCRNLPDLSSSIFHIHTNGLIESQKQFDERLVQLHNAAPPPLLRQPGDWERSVNLAYEKQSAAVAYRERNPSHERKAE